ncbi:MAG: protein kinase, partial [Phycisphaerae bacterium]|nr:protein kinase [Phycisphaerae bacterium]
MEFFAEPVKQITCGKCGRAIDASGAKPLSTTQCPGCGAEVPVPAQFKDFLLLKQLGQGSSGIVFKALDQKLHRQVAVKVLVGKDDDEQAALECIREARTLARLNHRNIVRIYGLDEHQGQHFIVMELLTRGTAGGLIRSSRRPSERRILDLAIAVAGGLDAAHRAGLVHMDIKPENILFNADGIPKLIDFGAAQFRHRSKDEGVVGTPYYIAPETARGRDPDFRSDMYSFGATLFHLLAGRPPFEAEDARSLIARRLTEAAPSVLADRKDVSLRTARIIERLLERDPQHRPGAYDELIEELEQARAVLRVDPDSIDVEDLPAVELAAALGSPMGRSTSARTALSTRTLVAGARPSALGRWLWGSAAFVVLLVGAIAWIVLPGETEPTPVQPPNGPAIAIAPAAPPSPPAAPTTPPTPAPLPPSPPVSPPPPSVPPASALAPVPAARWTFDTTDSTPIGSLSRPANVADGDLVLDGKAHLAIEAIDRDLGERTFEVWVTLGNLDQRAGGVFTVETLNGVVFDGIVYGEKQPGCWISGSDNFRRSQALGGPAETSLEPVHLAITYAADGRISFYRNGEPYGDSYIKGNLVTYRANQYRLLFGLRHTAGGDGHFKGRLHEARLYDRVLDAAEIKRSFAVGFDGKIVPPTKPLDEPGTLVAMGKIVEAEDIEGAPLVDAKWPGFSGTGFVDFQQVSGERLAFAVEASTGGRHQLRLRYALKDSGRDLALIVNGDRTSIHFPSTNTWQAWRTIDFDVALKPSRNVITLETTGQEGPNLDTIQVLSGDTLTRVPDPKETTAGYTLLYDLDLGRLGNSITYDVDNRAT